MSFSWTPEAVARLRGLLPHYSSSQIGAKLGCSRCAVIGKKRRLGLTTPRPDGKSPTRFPTPAPDNGGGTKERLANKLRIGSYGWPTLVAHEPPMARAAPDEPVSLDLSLLELTYSTCKWPHGDLPPFLFCGNPTAWGSSWCPHHAERVAAPRKAGA